MGDIGGGGWIGGGGGKDGDTRTVRTRGQELTVDAGDGSANPKTGREERPLIIAEQTVCTVSESPLPSLEGRYVMRYPQGPIMLAPSLDNAMQQAGRRFAEEQGVGAEE